MAKDKNRSIELYREPTNRHTYVKFNQPFSSKAMKVTRRNKYHHFSFNLHFYGLRCNVTTHKYNINYPTRQLAIFLISTCESIYSSYSTEYIIVKYRHATVSRNVMELVTLDSFCTPCLTPLDFSLPLSVFLSSVF